MNAFLTWLGDGLAQLGGVIVDVLPKSPFVYVEMSPEVSNVLGYVNYFVPVSACVAIAEAWLVAIGGWYMYQIVLRWVKAVE